MSPFVWDVIVHEAVVSMSDLSRHPNPEISQLGKELWYSPAKQQCLSHSCPAKKA